ncbi:MAG: sugar ABC transporter ATP-binding protein [Planctomycetota bacterium]
MKADRPENEQPLLQMKGIVKDFPGTRALDNVDFEVRAGEIHSLIGENGAGKSTLMNILAGRLGNYQGTISFNGGEVEITCPRQGRQLGIAVIYQDLSIVPNFTVAENIMLGDEKARARTRTLDRRRLSSAARQVISHLRFDLDPNERVGNLGRAGQCLVEIAGAVRRNVKLIVFDEPTAALGSEDVRKLFDVIRQLRSRGLAIVYISHRIAELPRLADRVTVLRDGKVVGTKDIDQCKVSDMTRMMLGHDLAEVFPEKTNRPGKTILKVNGLSRPGVFENISFELRAGEILGIAGLVGSGRTEIVRAILGAEKAVGAVVFQGRTVRGRSPAVCRGLGIGMVPEDRKRQANITGRTVAENLNITILDRLAGALGFQSPKRLAASADRMVERMKIDPPQLRANIQTLSGGNQQKVIVGRWLAAESKVLIFDEPTQGIDMGTKSQIYAFIMELAHNGRAIILISSELIEIAELADRVLVIRNGRLIEDMPADETNEDELFALCAGKAESK